MDVDMKSVLTEIQALPPEKREDVARYVHTLREQVMTDRNAVLDEVLAHDLTTEEIDEWETAMQSTRKIDVGTW